MAAELIRKEYASGLVVFQTIDEASFIGCITINNPAKRNALSRVMWFALSEILDDCLLKFQTIRVLIITGQGSIAFSSGADLSEKEPEGHDRSVPQIRVKLRQYPIPVLAQINGFCLGGGLALAMSTDIRLAASTALFSIPAVKLGVPCPKDIVDRLIQLVGESQAKLILYTGDRITAQQALDIGLIQHVCDDAEKLDLYVQELARSLARNAPLSIRAIKTMIEHDADEARIQRAIDTCSSSNDMHEGRNAFREKRPAHFMGS